MRWWRTHTDVKNTLSNNEARHHGTGLRSHWGLRSEYVSKMWWFKNVQHEKPYLEKDFWQLYCITNNPQGRDGSDIKDKRFTMMWFERGGVLSGRERDQVRDVQDGGSGNKMRQGEKDNDGKELLAVITPVNSFKRLYACDFHSMTRADTQRL